MTPRATVALFRNRITAWGRTHKRDFPWRRTRNPFALLVAETMLQHTSARQVASVFPTFLKKFPTPEQLAHARLADIQRVLRPLGKAHRALDLRNNASTLLDRHQGRVPRSYEQLLELRGIGRYSSLVILNAAFGEGHPVVDSNINRVFCRFFSTRWSAEDVKRRPEPWNFAAAVVPDKGVNEFNLYLLDFAAMVCTVRRPKCQICPLASACPSSTASK